MTVENIILALVAAIVSPIVLALISRKRNETEIQSIATKAANETVAQLQESLEKTQARLDIVALALDDERNKRRALEAVLDQKSAQIAELQRQVALQAARIAEQDAVIEAMRGRERVMLKGVQLLVRQIRAAGLHPDWEPPNGESKA